jgi:mannosyltransferase
MSSRGRRLPRAVTVDGRSPTSADLTSPGRLPRHLRRAYEGSLTLDIAVASGLALVLGLIRLGTPSLWVDEAFTAHAVRETLVNPIDQYHWLYYAALKPWSLVAGTSEWALRLPSVFASMLACGLLVVLGRRLVERRVALVAGLFLATSPFLVKWSQQARSYSLVLAAGVLATLLLLRALERRSPGAWATYGLALSLVFVLQPVSALVLVPAHLVPIVRRRATILPHGLVAPCVVVVLGAPWVFARSRQTPAQDWLPRPSPEVALNTLLDVSGVAGVGVALAIVGLVVLRRTGRSDLGVWLGTWAFSPFLLALLISFVQPVYLDRYLITAAPAFALLAAIAVLGVGVRWGALLACVAILATATGLARWYGYGENGWRGEGWRPAVETVLTRRAEDGAAVVVVPWWASPAATYYGAPATSTSTDDAIWVLVWSETGHRLPASERRPLGFGDHVLVERLQFGRRVSAQLWRRER